MRKKLFGMMAALLASAGVAHAQQSSNLNSSALVQAQYGGAPMADAGQVYPGAGSPNLGPYSQIQNQQTQPQAPTMQGATANPSTCAPSCQLCCPEPWKIHGWLGADFQMWFPPAMNLAPNLVTTGAGGTGAQLVGTSFPLPMILGFRIDTGMFTNPEESRGFQSITNSFFANTGVITVTPAAGVAGPFVNTNGGATTVALTAAGPNTFSANTSFTDTDANSIRRVIKGENTSVYLIYGPKFATVEEDMTFTYNVAAGGPFAGPAAVLEEFHTRNYFIGGQVGFWLKENLGAFVADLQAKCAVGYSYANLIVLGSNTDASNSQMFTNDRNIGYFGTNYFSVIPEVDGNLALKVTDHIQVRIGYSFLAYLNVQRPGDQLVAALAPVAGAGAHTAPVNPFTSTTYVIHGLNVGASWHY
ncbi:MAG TPA: BBP7 family outer membrane beta-barrel protein [Gemmataceae bacterium]|nr:BBP7 family outer membrane beta-barrel protein [Gemmataceae bacterium]